MYCSGGLEYALKFELYHVWYGMLWCGDIIHSGPTGGLKHNAEVWLVKACRYGTIRPPRAEEWWAGANNLYLYLVYVFVFHMVL